MMLLRANSLAKGHSGVRPVVIDTLCEMLNRGVVPYVPSQGSVGASGNRANGFSARIVSTVGNIEASATTGNIWLWNIGALVVGGVPAVVSPYALYAPEGQINIQTSSPLVVSQARSYQARWSNLVLLAR